MRYSISEPVSFEEATPRGLLKVQFDEGVVGPEDGSDEQYAIEYVLIPAGIAEPVSEPTKRKAKAEKDAEKAPVADATDDEVKG